MKPGEVYILTKKVIITETTIDEVSVGMKEYYLHTCGMVNNNKIIVRVCWTHSRTRWKVRFPPNHTQ